MFLVFSFVVSVLLCVYYIRHIMYSCECDPDGGDNGISISLNFYSFLASVLVCLISSARIFDCVFVFTCN